MNDFKQLQQLYENIYNNFLTEKKKLRYRPPESRRNQATNPQAQATNPQAQAQTTNPQNQISNPNIFSLKQQILKALKIPQNFSNLWKVTEQNTQFLKNTKNIFKPKKGTKLIYINSPSELEKALANTIINGCLLIGKNPHTPMSAFGNYVYYIALIDTLCVILQEAAYKKNSFTRNYATLSNLDNATKPDIVEDICNVALSSLEGLKYPQPNRVPSTIYNYPVESTNLYTSWRRFFEKDYETSRLTSGLQKFVNAFNPTVGDITKL